jgi:cation diffusion facilitator family transporter
MNDFNFKTGEKGVWISISAYIILAGFKLVMGNFGDSDALKADGLNNFTDVFASFAVLIGLRISQKPADGNHKYGHSRAETLSSLIASFIMFIVGIQVVVDSIRKFYGPLNHQPQLFTALVALFSAVVMYFVYRININLSRKIESKALYSAAQDNKSDALVSIGAAIGIVGAYFGVVWLDPLTAAIVGLLICNTAWDIFRDSAHDLTDGFEVQTLKEIEETITNTPGVMYVKEIKARLYGNQTMVDATLFVDSNLTVSQGHAITEAVEKRLLDNHKINNAHLHIEPI